MSSKVDEWKHLALPQVLEGARLADGVQERVQEQRDVRVQKQRRAGESLNTRTRREIRA